LESATSAKPRASYSSKIIDFFDRNRTSAEKFGSDGRTDGRKPKKTNRIRSPGQAQSQGHRTDQDNLSRKLDNGKIKQNLNTEFKVANKIKRAKMAAFVAEQKFNESRNRVSQQTKPK
jgi:hypothetical protein